MQLHAFNAFGIGSAFVLKVATAEAVTTKGGFAAPVWRVPPPRSSVAR